MVPPSAPPAGSAFGVSTVSTAALDGVDMQVERSRAVDPLKDG